MPIGNSREKKWKNIEWILARSFYDIGFWPFIFLTVGAFGALFGQIIFPNHIGYLISSYIFFLIGLALSYHRHPVGAITGFLLIVFLGVITLAALYQTNFDFLTAGITGILVIITGWYAKNMHTQIKIMNNEKFGKVIIEVSKSIFSPFKDDLKDIKLEFETNSYIEQILPTKIESEEKKRGVIQNYLEGDILITSTVNSSRVIQSSAKPLLNINDEHLPFTIRRLKQLNIDYNKNIDDLKVRFKKFDDDFLPYFQEFKLKCIGLANPLSLPLPSDDIYFKLVLEYTLKKQNATLSNIGRFLGLHTLNLEFINEKRDELYQWIQNISILRDDVNNIENKKIEIIGCISDMIKEINILFYVWKKTYYLTEDELH